MTTTTAAPTLVVKTYLRTRMPDNTLHIWVSDGKPCRYLQAPTGYTSVEHLRKELKFRFAKSHEITDIENGIKLVPKIGFYQAYAWQEVTLES